jgi:hypothetical protein
MTVFEDILLQYPSAPWDWQQVSANPSVSFQFIIDHPKMPWVPRHVSKNINVTERIVREHLYYEWDYESLCFNPNMSFKFFNEFIIKPDAMLRVDWHAISSNPSIHMIDVIDHPQLLWIDRYLSTNPNLTSNFILNEGKDRQWCVPLVCSNPGITARDIFKSTLKSMFDWDYRNLSANPNIPIKYVCDRPDQDWNYHSISTNASLTDIQTYHQVDWDAHGLSMNTNINMEYIKSHPNVRWHRPALLSNANINISTIIDNHQLFSDGWCDPYPVEFYISSNPSITPSWISRNKKNVNWRRLSANAITKQHSPQPGSC